jgi:WD40 repeat protein
MAGTEILREVVVKISDDGKKLKGTGFFVSETEIVTCYHVLKDKSDQLSEYYFVKHDDWGDWIRVMPLMEKCFRDKDIAFLECPIPIKLELRRIPFKPWDGNSKEFRSRGYDCNTIADEGASTVEGEDCKIIDYTSRGSEPRLQLSTIKKTLLTGRSGSPVWSVGQKAIVGIIDYQAGDESSLKDKSMAILIEKLPIDFSRPRGEPINVPKLPVDFLPRPDDLKMLRELVLSPGEGKSAITGKTSNIDNGCFSSVGLRGMGGIGKSVLAAAQARDEKVLEAFPDDVIWITLGQRPNLPNRQLQLLKFLEKDHRAISDAQDGLGCLRLLLSEKSCLIILDDVWAMDDVRAFDALGPNCRMLVTTRDQEIVRGLKAREFCLDVLNEEDSLKLLALSSGLKREDLGPKAKEVAKECDCLPLALAMVGSMAKAALARGRTDPWEHILHRLLSADLDKIKAEFPDYPYPNLLRAIEVSVESLEQEEQKRYLELAVFSEDTEVPEAALQLLWGLDEYDTRDLADHLADRSLAWFNSGRLGLHDLQHDFAVKRVVDLLALHRKLLDAYEKECPNGWHTGPNDGYFLQHLTNHLLHSGRKKDLKELALDFRWLEVRLEKTEITSLISDFDLLPDDDEMKLCRDCLRLSSHVLFRDSSMLAGQMLGRMQHLSFPGFKDLINQARMDKGRPWLRPMTASLTSPRGPLIRILSGHVAWVNSVALTPDGRRAVSASSDGTLKVWDLESGQEIRTLRGHAGKVNSVALTPDGRRAVSASSDGALKVWDLESGQEIRTFQGHAGKINAVALTPDDRRAVSASSDGTLKVWDLESDHEIRTLGGHVGKVNSVALTPDGRRAVSASSDRTLKVWDLESGQEIRTLRGHAGGVNFVALTPDGRRAVSASSDRTLKVWDLESGQKIRTLRGHADKVNAVALTPDGRRAVSASSDRTLKVWDLESDREIRTLRGHADKVNAVALTPDGRRAVSASSDRTLKVWDLESDQEICTLRGHAGGVNAVALTPDGCRAVSASSDGTLKVWDLENGQEIWTLRGHVGGVNFVALTSDGRRAVSASSDRTLKVWDLENGREIWTLRGHADKVNSIALTSDGRRAVSTSSDRTLKVWDLENGQEIWTLRGHASGIKAIALTPDGRRAVSTSSDHTLKVWDLERGREVRTLQGHVGGVKVIALIPDGRRAVSTSSDRTLKVWDLENGQEIWAMRSHADRIDAIALTPDGCRAVSTSSDRTLQVWDLESGSLIATFTGDSFMFSRAISPDGRTIVAGEALGRIHFLRLEGYPLNQDAKP